MVPAHPSHHGDESTVTIKEESGHSSNADPGIPIIHDEYTIGYKQNHTGLYERPPVVGLYHEMAHIYDFINETAPSGEYHGTDGIDNGVDNDERTVVGLDIDGDDNPKTPETYHDDHPRQLTENHFRNELGVPEGPHYGS